MPWVLNAAVVLRAFVPVFIADSISAFISKDMMTGFKGRNTPEKKK